MRLRLFLASCALLFVFFYWRGVRRPPEVPPPAEALASPNESLIREHPDLMPEQIAVLLLKPDQEALAIARALAPAGVPFTVTRELGAAARHRIMFIPFSEQALRLDEPLQKGLHDFVVKGGQLVLQVPPGNTWPWLTGVRAAALRRTRKRLNLRVLADPGFAGLSEPEQQSIPLAAPEPAEGIWTKGLRLDPELGATAIAVYPETKDAAIARRALGAGTVYTLGFDLKDLVVRPQAQRHFDAARSAANGFEPAADVWSSIFGAWYERSAPFWARLRPAPGIGPLWLMTHSVEQGASLSQVREFEELENSRSVAATWFVEHPDAPFFDARMKSLAAELARAGQEVASHGVSHGSDFSQLPFGDGSGSGEYRPQTDEEGRTDGATLVGETGVSKRLLEKALPGVRITGFRVPRYAYPPALDAALELAGYRYDSSLLANACLTHFPFLLVRHRALANESSIIEFPVTFADEAAEGQAPEPAAMLSIAKKISHYGGVAVWEIHPNGQPGQRERLEAVLSGAPAGTRWMSLAQAAEFWSRRGKARFSFRAGAGPKEKLLSVSSPEGVGGLSFDLSSAAKRCSSEVEVSCAGRRLFIPPSVARREARIRISLE